MRSLSLGLAVALIASSSGAWAQVVNAPQVGGQGGGPFTDVCRPGDVMVGYNVVGGKAMNTFAVVCQAQNNGMTVGRNYGLRTWGKSTYNGGPYHSFDTPRCPPGAAISALQVNVNKFNELDSVVGTCAPIRANAGPMTQLQRTMADGQVFRQGPSACPPGMIAVGASGRYGALVDAVGLICAPPQLR